MKNVEDVYRLSPMQQGILFHTLRAPEAGTYVEQIYWTWHGAIELGTLQRAWARVVELQIADEPDAWSAAGFTVADGVVVVGSVRLRLVGRRDAERGIVGWTLAGVTAPDGDLDGLPTQIAAADPDGASMPATHPNGVTGLDHIVVLTPDLDRTLDAQVVSLGRVKTDTTSSFRIKHEPGNPAADANGNVKYPNVNSLVEMTDMREAQRSYEANLNIISATRRMIQRTLDILKA